MKDFVCEFCPSFRLEKGSVLFSPFGTVPVFVYCQQPKPGGRVEHECGHILAYPVMSPTLAKLIPKNVFGGIVALNLEFYKPKQEEVFKGLEKMIMQLDEKVRNSE